MQEENEERKQVPVCFPDFAASTYYFVKKGQLTHEPINKHYKLSFGALIESGLNKWILRPTCIKMGRHDKTANEIVLNALVPTISTR